MNTDSSQMLYPDFTHNAGHMNSMQPFPIGNIENNSDYYDIAEIKQKLNKKRKNKDGQKKHHSRVPTLNQTEYFTSRQEQAGHKNHHKSHSTRNPRKGGAAAHHHQTSTVNSYGVEDHGNYMVFDQSQMSDNNGMQFHKPGHPLS